MTSKSLLVELLVEELPPKSLKRLSEAFAHALADGLKSRGLAGAHSAVTPFATPRRLAVHVSGVVTVAPDQEVLRKLMPIAVAYDKDGRATLALRRALAKLGREALADLGPNATDGPDRLLVQSDGKADALFLRSLAKGSSLQVGLQFALEQALETLPIDKQMSYQLGDGWTSVKFVRPAHGLVALHGAELVPVTALGLEARRETNGHRFEAQMSPVNLRDADHYARQLEEQGAVIAGFDHRRADIARQLAHLAHRQNLRPIDDDALLDEVTALVERPNVLLCRFEPEFLAVPAQCLILTMKANQKYFPLLDEQGALTNQFLVVSNIAPADPSAVIQGNERVVRARLADAKFFFDQDRKKTLESRLPGLDRVVYHNKLGSLGERVRRVQSLAESIGGSLGGAPLAAAARRAAGLAKADLLTDMVGEFPELQGVMGGYYARHDGETEEIAFAIEDHYKPRFSGGALPRGGAGSAVALADKLEAIVGLFAIGQVPSGDKDPFALRRHALGVIRMLIEKSLPLDLDALVDGALQFSEQDAPQKAKTKAVVLEFVFDRLSANLREQGHTAQEVDAVLSQRPQRLADVPKRLAAVRAFAAMPEAAALASANKRIANILRKSEAGAAVVVEAALLAEPAERDLHAALTDAALLADALFVQGEYAASLRELAVLKAPVDAFFDTVMVNADDAKLRSNRLALLSQLHRAMNRVADLSRLAS